MHILYYKLTDLDVGHSTDNIMTKTSQPMFWNYQQQHAAWLYCTMQITNFSGKSSFVKIKNHSFCLDLDNSRDWN